MVSIQIQQVTGNGITFSELIEDCEVPGLCSERKRSRSRSITRHYEILIYEQQVQNTSESQTIICNIEYNLLNKMYDHKHSILSSTRT